MSAKTIAALAFGMGLIGAPAAMAQTDPAPTAGAKSSDPKTGTSPPVEAGGAGVKGKSDAGAGQSNPKSDKR